MDQCQSNLQLGRSGGPAKNFHGVGIGPLSKILAVNSSIVKSDNEIWKFPIKIWNAQADSVQATLKKF